MIALVVSTAAAGGDAAGSGTLVVENGAAPDGVAAVTLLIKGTVVGRLSSGSPDFLDTVVLDALDPRGKFSANATAGTQVNTTEVSPRRRWWPLTPRGTPSTST